MSSNLMDTEVGGETPQYESIKTVTEPHKKSGGQFGEPETSVDANPSAQAEAKAERGEKTAENIRYGQAISEHGMGGQTTSSTGQANQDSGFGGAADQAAQNDDAVETRKESGYGGDRDMDRTIGA